MLKLIQTTSLAYRSCFVSHFTYDPRLQVSRPTAEARRTLQALWTVTLGHRGLMLLVFARDKSGEPVKRETAESEKKTCQTSLVYYAMHLSLGPTGVECSQSDLRQPYIVQPELHSAQDNASGFSLRISPGSRCTYHSS